jgi:hypothetical protein
MMSRVVILAGVLLCGSLSIAALAGPSRAPVLVELFTSQGCSDCPPADRIVTELAARRDIVALTFPITYWDMLGWKDTFATEANTLRQKAYAKAMSRSGLTTPQMVIGGADQVVGNQRDKVMAAIAARAAQDSSHVVVVGITPAVGHVTISIPAAPNLIAAREPATIWLMRTLSHARVTVGGGENNTRELTYTNVVRELERLGVWDGGAKDITLPIRAEAGKQDGIAVIVQRKEYGPVLGAAFAQLPQQ